MFYVVPDKLGLAAVVCDRVQQPALEQPEPPEIGVAKAAAGLEDLIEHRLKTGQARDGAKNVADCVLLLAQNLELSRQVRIAFSGATFVMASRG